MISCSGILRNSVFCDMKAPKVRNTISKTSPEFNVFGKMAKCENRALAWTGRQFSRLHTFKIRFFFGPFFAPKTDRKKQKFKLKHKEIFFAIFHSSFYFFLPFSEFGILWGVRGPQLMHDTPTPKGQKLLIQSESEITDAS